MSLAITSEVMDVAVSIEKDIPSRITGENRVFIRAVIARAITAAVAAEREACAVVAEGEAKGFDFERAWAEMDDDSAGYASARLNVAHAIRAGSTPC